MSEFNLDGPENDTVYNLNGPLDLEGLTEQLDRHRNATLWHLGFSSALNYPFETPFKKGEIGNEGTVNSGSGSELRGEIGGGGAPKRKGTSHSLAREAFRDYVRQATPLAATGRWAGLPDWSDNDALMELIDRESDYNPTAQNPRSTAYGLFQFLDSTWASYGIAKTSDPLQQTIAGLRYIKSRYSTPERALEFHNKNNWY
jgi:hypothetical protein